MFFMVFYRTRLLKWSELPIHNKNVIGQLGVPKSLDNRRTKRELQINNNFKNMTKYNVWRTL